MTTRILLIASAALLTACGEPPGMGPSTTSDWETSASSSEASSSTEAGSEAGSETGPPEPICIPGSRRCDGDAVEECAPTGLEWAPGEDCGDYGVCQPCIDAEDCDQVRCATPCDVEGRVPSSQGCSFFATRLLEGDNTNGTRTHAVIVANPDETRTATVSWFETPEGTREENLLETRTVAPGATELFVIDSGPIASDTSLLRAGGIFRVGSDIPIVAYLHSPGDGTENGGDASMLLPEETFRTDFVIPSFPPRAENPVRSPSYFVVIALEDDTEVTWTAPQDTFGNGLPLPYVAQGETGTATMNRFDNMRIAASRDAHPNDMGELRDVSGAYVHANKPIAVFAGVTCASVPYDAWTCDHMQEQAIPLQYWGEEYVAAAHPARPGTLDELWRVYAGADDMTVTVTPAQPGTPINFANRGDWVELTFPQGTDVVMTGDKPFMPVQYLMSNRQAEADPLTALGGDPAMYQFVPVEQFLTRYVFATGKSFTAEYVQITRSAGGADVTVDGVTVTGYRTIGAYEIADWLITEGSHVAESDQPFGIAQVAYTDRSSYAYPGGVQAEEIFLP